MGSGSSIKAKPVTIDQDESTTSVKSLSLPPLSQSSRLVSQVVHHESTKDTGEDYEKLYKDLEKQFGALEVANLDLEDKVQILEQQLDYHKNATSHLSTVPEEEEDEHCEGTVKAKDLIIKKLETEIETLRQDMKKLRIKCKKKIRAANAKLTESQQGSSLKAFELNNELAQLREENERLTGKIQELDENPRPKTAASQGDAQIEESDSRKNLIIDLSSRISQQDVRIIELQNSVHEKDKIIEQMKKDHEKLKAEIAQRPPAPDPELSELQQIAAEIKALKKTKSKKKKRVVHEPSLALDFRGSSGLSRDSGIVHNELVVGNSPEAGDTGVKDFKTSLSDEDDKWGTDTEEPVDRNTGTPLNIRQISAMKKKRKPKDITEMMANVKTNEDYQEVDSLIQSIDQTASASCLSQVSM